MSQLQHSSRRSSESSDSLAFANSAAKAPGKQPLTGQIPAGRAPVQLQAAEQAPAAPAAPEAAAQDAAAQITLEDVRYEFIAHNFGYKDTLGSAEGALLRQWGYQPQWASRINDAATGFFVGLLMPDSDHSDLTPILVFRGTEGGSDFGDIIADLHPIAVGYNQFHDNRAFVQQLIAEAGGAVNVTGHSLGGALAQHAAATFTGSVRQVFTYQAPAIQASAARDFAQQEQRPEVRHHIAAGDVVDNAGDAHLDGDFFRHDVGGGPAAHVRYVFSTPEFAAQREQLGITDEVMNDLGVAQQTSKGPVEHSESHPEPIFGAVAEGVRRPLGAGLYPVLNGLQVLFRNDDKRLRQQIAGMDDAQLAGYPVSERAYMIDRLCRGITGNADEDAIVRVLRASTSDAVAVIEVVGAYRIAQNLHGRQYQELAAFYRANYYTRASQDQILAILRSCIDGRTSEWEEEMIADILVLRSDGRAIITRIGAIYSGGGFAEGLRKIQWELDGRDQRRVDAIYATS
jgi:hypothetical protein